LFSEKLFQFGLTWFTYQARGLQPDRKRQWEARACLQTWQAEAVNCGFPVRIAAAQEQIDAAVIGIIEDGYWPEPQ